MNETKNAGNVHRAVLGTHQAHSGARPAHLSIEVFHHFPNEILKVIPAAADYRHKFGKSAFAVPVVPVGPRADQAQQPPVDLSVEVVSNRIMDIISTGTSHRSPMAFNCEDDHAKHRHW
jgi:hypothetical protein